MNKGEENSIYPYWNYIGSKRSLINWILDKLKHYNYDTILDMFGGSGIVTHSFLTKKKLVWYNDLMPSIRFKVESLIRSRRPISEDLLVSITDEELAEPNNTTQEYFTAYFTKQECEILDQLLANIHTLDKSSPEFGIFLYALSQTAITKQGSATFHQGTMNQRDRDDDPTSSWHEPITDLIWEYVERVNDYIRKKPTYQFNLTDATSLAHSEFTKDMLDNIDLVYADPPFIGEDSTFGNYIHNYHMLEYFANYDNFDPTYRKTDTKLVKPKEDNELLISNRKWLQPEFVSDAFQNLAKLASSSTLVLSYRDDSELSVTDIGKILSTQFSRVEIHQHRHKSQYKRRPTFNDVLFIGSN